MEPSPLGIVLVGELANKQASSHQCQGWGAPKFQTTHSPTPKTSSLGPHEYLKDPTTSPELDFVVGSGLMKFISREWGH